jgi:uracil-DNA glycosylase
MTTLSDRLDKNWRHIIRSEFDVGGDFDYAAMEGFLQGEEYAKRIFYPKREEIFNALNLTPFEKVKVVIIGQDPYHGPGQAHGLCFSTKSEDIPRSLRNIYEECGIEKPSHGDLTEWAKQGVLLLNATLTVQEGKAGSHQDRGWEEFTGAVIRAVNKKPEAVVFMLWGLRAQKKGTLITDREKHLVLEAFHPSARVAHSHPESFLGCGHFDKANEYLKKQNLDPIDWQKISSPN